MVTNKDCIKFNSNIKLLLKEEEEEKKGWEKIPTENEYSHI